MDITHIILIGIAATAFGILLMAGIAAGMILALES